MGPPPQGFCFCAPWPWGTGEQSMPRRTWWVETMGRVEGAEGGDDVGAGLRLFLRFGPRSPGFDLDHALLSFPVSALFSRLLGWSKNGERRSPGSMAITDESEQRADAVFATVAAAAVAMCLAALFVSDERPRCRRRRQRLSASALATTNSEVARPRALPAPDDGLRILSSNGEYLDNVLHGTSIGAGDDDDEPVLVARVEASPADMTGANAGGVTEQDRSEKEREEEEAAQLKALWLSLLEREQRLELRQKELDDFREQEAAMRELEHRASVAAVEARLMELKVSSLEEEKQRLAAQASELDAVRSKLSRAKEKLRALRARVQGEQEAAALREALTELEKNGEERERALVAEATALRKANAGLEEENMELALRLQDAEKAASSVNLVLEEDMVEEASYLRETNERLTRQIEQLHSDHCAHVEELVYLKWVNACLRHELRGNGNGNDHDEHASSAKRDHDGGGLSLTAMDLSKSMSYRSSERAKQLMLRYGNLGPGGFDPALFSPLHESLYGDGEGYDDEQGRAHKDGELGRSPGVSAATVAAGGAGAPTKRAGPGKLKFLKNIKKMLRKGHHGHGHGGGEDRDRKKEPIDEHLEKAMRWLASHDALDSDNSYESTPLSSCERTPQSSVTTVDSRPRTAAARGGMNQDREAEMVRSKSDAGASYGREGASPYHALRMDHPGGVHAPEERDLRRRSEELGSAEAERLRTRGMHAE